MVRGVLSIERKEPREAIGAPYGGRLSKEEGDIPFCIWEVEHLCPFFISYNRVRLIAVLSLIHKVTPVPSIALLNPQSSIAAQVNVRSRLNKAEEARQARYQNLGIQVKLQLKFPRNGKT
ncbi:MAG: hypothetical protein CL912_23480 [Deltaproteobacteria bacterium]|nr:hypothetical protein [Deltaproteobacteria bacterium]